MPLLAMDTATRACSAAVWMDDGVVAHRFAEMARGHSEALMPMVRAVVGEAGLAFGDLRGIAVTTGPGAFTGLRIGLAAARGLALALALPCVGVTTLEAVAEGVAPAERRGRNVLIALDAKRADIYVQLFSPILDPLSTPAAMMPSDLARLVAGAPLIVAGDAADAALTGLTAAGVDALASSAPAVPDAARVAAIAANRAAAGFPSVMPEPLYLRAPDVTLSANSGRLRP